MLPKKMFSKNSKKIRYTHFLSVPLIITPNLQNKLAEFYGKLAEVDKYALKFQYNMPLHITIGVLTLQDFQTEMLIKALEQCRQTISDSFNHPKFQAMPKPYSFTMNGLGAFGPLKDTVAVFGEITEKEFTDRLNSLTHCIVQILLDHGVIKHFRDIPHIAFNKNSKQFRVEKFHVTILKRNRKYGDFDSDTLMQHLDKFEFGKVEINRVALRRMDAIHTEIAAAEL